MPFSSSAKDEMNSCNSYTVNDWRRERSQNKTIGRVVDIMMSVLRPRRESVKRKALQVQEIR